MKKQKENKLNEDPRKQIKPILVSKQKGIIWKQQQSNNSMHRSVAQQGACVYWTPLFKSQTAQDKLCWDWRSLYNTARRTWCVHCPWNKTTLSFPAGDRLSLVAGWYLPSSFRNVGLQKGKSSKREGKNSIWRAPTLPMYSESRSCSACRTELHSATIRSRRSSRVQEESAMRAAPLMMLSRRSSREGRNLSSLKLCGSTMICFCRGRETENKCINTKKVLNLPVLLPLLLKIICPKILPFNISLQNERGGGGVRFIFSHTKRPTSQELNGRHYWLRGLNRILESISLDAEAQAVIFINWTNQ